MPKLGAEVQRVNELRHKNIGAKYKISIELGAEFNIWCRSPQLGADVTAVSKLLVPNIYCPKIVEKIKLSPRPEKYPVLVR